MQAAYQVVGALCSDGFDGDGLGELCRPLAQHPACIGLDLLCYDPDMDDDHRTGAVAVVDLLRRILVTR